MAEIKEPEEAVKVIMDALQFLQDVKVKAEWPIPVKKDRDGKLAKDYTIKDWYLKMQEELAEALNEEISAWPLDGTPKREAHLLRDGLCDRILEENCDMIHTIFSKLHQFGYSEDEIAVGISRSNKKARERGLIE